MRNRKSFIQLLAKIEYGVAIFCFKLQQQAIKEGRDELARKLEVHAVQEDKHGKMLSAIALDAIDIDVVIPKIDIVPISDVYRSIPKNHWRLSRTANGRWVSIFRSGQNIVKNSIPPTNKPKILQWDSSKYPGEQLTGILENFDGLSYRYLAGRLLFRGRAAFDYLWTDRLGLMFTLEEETAFFYHQMLEVLDEKIRSLANSIGKINITVKDIKIDNSKIKEIRNLTNMRSIISLIINDELSHANYLKEALNEFSTRPEKIIQKWRDRIFWARPALLVDFIYFFVRG